MNQVLREEKKYLIGIHEFLRKSRELEKVLLQDRHNAGDGYMIRSLYFDTVYDQDYFEKQEGIELRRKIRLRIYDPNARYAMLEMKQKQGVQQRKRSLKVSREDAESIMRGNYSPLLKYEDPFAAELYAFMLVRCYRPCSIVQYQRKAFIAKENHIRVTFDHHIVSSESCLDLFSENLNMNPVLDPYDVVLEVKFNGFLLGYIKDMLKDVDKSELSVSKYVLARQNAYQTHI